MNEPSNEEEGEQYYAQYRALGDGDYALKPKSNTVQSIPDQAYKAVYDFDGDPVLKSTKINSDVILDLPDDVSTEIVAAIDEFWKPEVRRKFKELGYIYKRGILLYGAPGTGKTCTINKISKSIFGRGGKVLIDVKPDIVVGAIEAVREIEGDVPFVVIYEDLDNWLRRSEETILGLLDGQDQVGNIVYLATTNYIDRIPDRVKNRPSRFAEVIKAQLPSKACREFYLNHKAGEVLDKEALEFLIEFAGGFTLDQLKDLVISVYCMGISPEIAIERMRKMSGIEEPEEE